MQVKASMQRTIEPKFQEFIDSKMKIASATFGRYTDEETLKNTMPLYFAGMGLARAKRSGGRIIWVGTQLFMELEKEPTRPFDLTPFMSTTTGKEDNLPNMTGSLRLIIADIISQ